MPALLYTTFYVYYHVLPCRQYIKLVTQYFYYYYYFYIVMAAIESFVSAVQLLATGCQNCASRSLPFKDCHSISCFSCISTYSIWNNLPDFVKVADSFNF